MQEIEVRTEETKDESREDLQKTIKQLQALLDLKEQQLAERSLQQEAHLARTDQTVRLLQSENTELKKQNRQLQELIRDKDAERELHKQMMDRYMHQV